MKIWLEFYSPEVQFQKTSILLLDFFYYGLFSMFQLQKSAFVHFFKCCDWRKVNFGERRKQEARSHNRGWNVFRSPIFISAAQFVILLLLLLHCFIWEQGDMLSQYYTGNRTCDQILDVILVILMFVWLFSSTFLGIIFLLYYNHQWFKLNSLAGINLSCACRSVAVL